MRTPDEYLRLIRHVRSVALVVNIRSRKGEQAFHTVKRALEDHRYTVDATPVTGTRELLGATQRAIAHGHALVCVGGGDGTMSAVVDDFVNRDVVLGVLPLGTANNFSKSLGISQSITEAIHAIIHGQVLTVDLGVVNGDYFANAVDIGPSSITAKKTSLQLKRFLGELAYVVIGTREVWGRPHFHCRLHFDDHDESLTAHEIIIANGEYFGETQLRGGASLESHRLTVYVQQYTSRWQRITFWIQFLLNRRSAFKRLRIISTTKFDLDTDPPQLLSLDGEITGSTPAHFGVAPQALHVLAP